MKSEGKTNFLQANPGVLDIGSTNIRQESKLRSFFFGRKNGSFQHRLESFSLKSQHFLEDIKSLGFTGSMDVLEKGKLSVFNQLNFFQFVSGIVVPLMCFFGNGKFPVNIFIIACLPACVNLVILFLNFYFRYEAGMLAYFILYPLITSVVY
ncbi:MAG TPA: hypothetical protein VFE04_05790, partial [Puia sp.]|nr:hypothetical protein [Puia sp.]